MHAFNLFSEYITKHTRLIYNSFSHDNLKFQFYIYQTNNWLYLFIIQGFKKNGISSFPWFKSFFHSIINYFQFKWNQDTNSEYNDLFVLVYCFSSSYWINGQNDNTCVKPLYISKLLIISKNHNYDLCKFLVKEGNKQLIQSKVKDWKIYFNRDITSK